MTSAQRRPMIRSAAAAVVFGAVALVVVPVGCGRKSSCDYQLTADPAAVVPGHDLTVYVRADGCAKSGEYTVTLAAVDEPNAADAPTTFVTVTLGPDGGDAVVAVPDPFATAEARLILGRRGSCDDASSCAATAELRLPVTAAG